MGSHAEGELEPAAFVPHVARDLGRAAQAPVPRGTQAQDAGLQGRRPVRGHDRPPLSGPGSLL